MRNDAVGWLRSDLCRLFVVFAVVSREPCGLICCLYYYTLTPVAEGSKLPLQFFRRVSGFSLLESLSY